jgi:hypothetical protein
METVKWIAVKVLVPIAVIVIALWIFTKLAERCECKKTPDGNGAAPEATINADGTVQTNQ